MLVIFLWFVLVIMLVLYVGFELLEIIFIFFLNIEGLVVGFVVLFVFLVGVVFF